MIKKAQEEIQKLNPSTKYKLYQMEEQKYWSFIPNWIQEFNTTHQIKNCLDIGIAYGTLSVFAKMISNCQLYGIDFMKYISDDIISKYNINYQLKNIELDTCNFDTKFDLIIFTEILEHLNYYPLFTLQKIKNMLSENGVIMLSTPDSNSAWGKTGIYKSWKYMPLINEQIEIKDDHIYQYNLDELIELITLVGLKIDKLEYSKLRDNYYHLNMQLSKF